jgi:hypothetical protein
MNDIFTTVVFSLNQIFRQLSRRVESAHLPFILSDEDTLLLTTYPPLKDFYNSVFSVKQLGLSFQEEGNAFIVDFKLKHPLYVYAKIADTILTADLL